MTNNLDRTMSGLEGAMTRIPATMDEADGVLPFIVPPKADPHPSPVRRP